MNPFSGISARRLTWAATYLIALTTGPAQAETLEEQELAVVERECRNLPNSLTKIQRCLRLATSNKVRNIWLPSIYGNVSSVYFSLKDYDNAIIYQQKGIDIYPKFDTEDILPQNRIIAFDAHFATLASKYERLALLQEIKSTILLRSGNVDNSLALARNALVNFTTTINLPNGSKRHSTYAKRADLLGRLCKQSEAESDMREAIAIAAQLRDYNAVQEYRTTVLSSCRKEYEDRLEQ